MRAMASSRWCRRRGGGLSGGWNPIPISTSASSATWTCSRTLVGKALLSRLRTRAFPRSGVVTGARARTSISARPYRLQIAERWEQRSSGGQFLPSSPNRRVGVGSRCRTGAIILSVRPFQTLTFASLAMRATSSRLGRDSSLPTRRLLCLAQGSVASTGPCPSRNTFRGLSTPSSPVIGISFSRERASPLR